MQNYIIADVTLSQQYCCFSLKRYNHWAGQTTYLLSRAWCIPGLVVGVSTTFGWTINHSISCDANANTRCLTQCTRFFNSDAHPLTGKFSNQFLRNVFRQRFQKLVAAFRYPITQAFFYIFAVDGKALC